MTVRRPIVCWLAVIGAAAVMSGCGLWPVTTGETQNDALSFDVGAAKSARVELRMGSGELRVSGGTQKMMEGTFAYNVADWKPVVDYRVSGTTGNLNIAQPNARGTFGNTVNKWDVRLNGEVALEVTAALGAGEAHLELGRLNLSGVEMSIGAGEVNMDLRGEPKRDYEVQIRGGVGKTVVFLPKDVGISAKAIKGIGEISIEGLEDRDGVWVNPDRVGAPVTVRVDVKGGVGEIRLVR